MISVTEGYIMSLIYVVEFIEEVIIFHKIK